MIFGKWDVLVQLGGDDFQDVAEAVFSDLPRFDAILDSDTLVHRRPALTTASISGALPPSTRARRPLGGPR